MQPDTSAIEFKSFTQTLETVHRNAIIGRDCWSDIKFRALTERDNTGVNQNGEDEKELNYLSYKKGHPFYLIKPKDLIPKFHFLENFHDDDFCFFKRDLLEQKLQTKGWSPEVIDLCTTLIHESIGFCVDKKFSNCMGVATMEIMFQAFDFLMWNKFATLDDLYKFFRHMILLYAVKDVPSSMMIFAPMECFILAQYFSMQFDSVFLLFKAVAVPKYLVKIYVDD